MFVSGKRLGERDHKMNLHQCQKKAEEIGFDNAKFWAEFPAGLVECQWLDAYMGVFKINFDGLRDGFLMVKEIDDRFPDLECSELWVTSAPPTHNKGIGR